MEEMFREYAAWRQKLEMIESKMKEEVDYWKGLVEKMKKDNERLEKEVLGLTKDQMARAREIEDERKKSEELQAKLERARELQPVEEALCMQCKNSMEESIVGQKELIIKQQADQFKIAELESKIDSLQKQLVGYKEKSTFLETVEQEQKRELEEHVEVLLKMEQERLVLLKEADKAKKEKSELETIN